MQNFIYILAVAATILQVFDVISTQLVLDKNRGREANGLMEKWMKLSGKWWPAIKAPVIVAIWGIAVAGGKSDPTLSLIVLGLISGAYSWVVWHNYKVAWRQA